ncbi:MAG: NAD(P)-dependent oxidoreductase [Gammaproteobacteria bacterium]|nr:NAD(P)-dependent oxidoreductase [Gammaproteobacteria bacterium]MBM4225296.1 NAD(P)-dependent oxidoreductase [Gammaproteobacteria bacterium]
MDLITGGLGFIGNELARQLLARGREIVIVDNRRRVAPRIADLTSVRVIEADLTDAAATRRAFAGLRPTNVFHLAAIHYIPECNADPALALRVNVEATQNVLDAAAAVGTRHFLLASTGAIYADAPHALTEEARVAPVDIYGWSKVFAEELVRWRAARGELRATVARFFNNYGPRETNRHIIPEILDQLRTSDELRLGTTSTRRDYIHTRDNAEALLRMADSLPERDRTVNIGTGVDASVDELVELLSELLGRPLRITRDPARVRPVDKQVQRADIARLTQLTGWQPQVKLRDGLAELLRFEGLLK